MNAFRASVAAVAVVAVVASCIGPTAVSIEVTTNACATLGQVDIYVGAPDAAFAAPSTSKAKGCAAATGKDVGTLTIVPSGMGDRLELAVVGSLGAGCSGPDTTDPTCIVARRALSYVPHTTLPLPIFLDSRCAGFPCPAGQTCVAVQGAPACVGETCDTDGGVVCNGDAGSPEGGVCLQPADAGVPTLKWSFIDHADTFVYEDQNRVARQPQLDGYFSSDDTTCASFFNTLAQDQPLAVDETVLASNAFTIAFDFNAISDSVLLQYVPTNASAGGYTISNLGGNLVVESNLGTLLGSDTANTADGKWHSFSMTVTGLGLSMYRDGVSFGTVATPWTAASGTLSIGAGSSINQVEFFKQ